MEDGAYRFIILSHTWGKHLSAIEGPGSVWGDPEMRKYLIAIEGPGVCGKISLAYRRSGEGGCGKILLP